jgi:predicted nucleotidyltransferase
MKSIILFVVGVFVGFMLLSNERVINSTNNPYQRSKTNTENYRYGNYDPSNDNKFSHEERDYFKKIAKFTEYNGEREISRWTSDIKIFVKGERKEELLEELNRIITELNDLINPIDILIVNREEESNFQILFGSQQMYNDFNPKSIKYTNDNWGLFFINSGKEITRGSMFVDTYRCEDLNGQKHLLREELTQSLGLTNDTYDYPESVFYQNWTETTEYAPIDRVLIDMLYNHW